MTGTGTPLDLAVVGHTNTGKTSLLRTLLRDPGFGEVADQPGTTRHVESAQLLAEDGTPLLILRDTPGLEDGMAVLEYTDRLIGVDERPDGPERIRRLLESPEATRRFEQEARVLATVLACDAALYVIDVRDPVLAKHRDELTLLWACGRPILPVLNFTRSPASLAQAWRDALARLGLHATVDFDTVAPALDGEAQLIDRLGLMLDPHVDTLNRLRKDLETQRQRRRADAARLIAELLVDAAALRLPCPLDSTDLATVTVILRKRTREREQRCVQSLLKRYRFNRSTFPHHPLPLEGERWGMDLFNPQALKAFGLQVGKGLAAGAMAGATVDAFTGGLSMGTATLLGAAVGGLWQGANQWGKRLMGRVAGYTEITVDDPVLQLLCLRQLALARALERRGHAAWQPIDAETLLPSPQLTQAPDDSQPANEPAALDQTLFDIIMPILGSARGHPEWSSIGDAPIEHPHREAVVRQLATRLQVELEE
ncbi:MAG TPA: GTPase/DUF3482 domain-containing protein [Castellaniella sp.]|nr:GTPase/DUF3482 domain-containing protein [Castellaniella sp.]